MLFTTDHCVHKLIVKSSKEYGSIIITFTSLLTANILYLNKMSGKFDDCNMVTFNIIDQILFRSAFYSVIFKNNLYIIE